MSLPFQNEYLLRKVAEAQLKSCAICYKPTPAVLITADNLDFFYVCLAHLKDEYFASPVLPDEYNELKKQATETTELLKLLELDIAKNKPSVFNNIPGFKSDNAKDAALKYENLVKEKEIHDKKLTSLEQQIKDFKFKNYVLNDDMYKVRLRAYINKKINEKRLKEISSENYFPSVPSGTPKTTGGPASSTPP